MDNELKRFPVELIKPTGASFAGSLYSPSADDEEPTIWYSIGVDLAEIELGENAPHPELFGTTIETEIELGGILIPKRSWIELPGVYGPVEDQGESSIYVSHSHCPINIEGIEIQRLQAFDFRIRTDIEFVFEFEDAGFADTRATLEVEATYHGLSYWLTDSFKADCKSDADIIQKALEAFGNCVDVAEYDPSIKDGAVFLRPKKP